MGKKISINTGSGKKMVESMYVPSVETLMIGVGESELKDMRDKDTTFSIPVGKILLILREADVEITDKFEVDITNKTNYRKLKSDMDDVDNLNKDMPDGLKKIAKAALEFAREKNMGYQEFKELMITLTKEYAENEKKKNN